MGKTPAIVDSRYNEIADTSRRPKVRFLLFQSRYNASMGSSIINYSLIFTVARFTIFKCEETNIAQNKSGYFHCALSLFRTPNDGPKGVRNNESSLLSPLSNTSPLMRPEIK